MKKIGFTMTMMFAMMIFVACASGDSEAPEDGSNPGEDLGLEEIIEEVTEGVEIEMETMNTELDSENFQWYLFTEEQDGVEGMAADAMMNSIPHSLVVARVSDEVDIESLATDIENNADPRKWVCAEAEKTVVETHGNLVLLVMSDENTVDDVVENFKGL